jgi:TPR repeat protein
MRSLLVLFICISLMGCTKTIKTLQATGGSRADGVVELSYGISAFEIIDKILWDKAVVTATEACQQWGYDLAKRFEGNPSNKCQMQGDFGSCAYFLRTYKYQCISSRNNVKDKRINISSGSCFVKPFDIDDCRVKAEQGDAKAQGLLGWLYEQREGSYEDSKAAANWYKKSANQGFAMAQYALGQAYYNGQGVLQDYKEAVKWTKKAAEQGFTKAQSWLGFYYTAILKDFVTAHMYLNIAATNGDKKAIEMRSKVIEMMSPSELKEAQKLAREWMRTH